MARKPPTSSTTPAATPTPAPHQRYLCVHGHFYQPPRENPWLETVELQESAAPYHDWNERITSECYAPNGASRIQNKANQITPHRQQLLADELQLRPHAAELAGRVRPPHLPHDPGRRPGLRRALQRPRLRRRPGLQPHHHAAGLRTRRPHPGPLGHRRLRAPLRPPPRRHVARRNRRLPLRPRHPRPGAHPLHHPRPPPVRPHPQTPRRNAPSRPRKTPPQKKLCHPERRSRASSCSAVEGPPKLPAPPVHPNPFPPQTPHPPPPSPKTPNALVDPTQPYLVRLDHGRSIAVFFYDGPSSRAIAFEGLLNDGKIFANRLTASFQPNNPNPQLAHVATDGESYGHHHKHGEMALSYALHTIEENHLATLTNYGEYLEKFPPTWEAEVVDDSSWSCSHGVERWRSNCGCNGGKPGWNQLWRGPLRDALDLLRDRTAPLTEAIAAPLLKDLWAARDAYIHVILDRSEDNIDRFLRAHTTHELTPAERVTVLELLELQRHTQLMYTSCGWFFDEISGIETVQIYRLRRPRHPARHQALLQCRVPRS